MPSVSDSVRPSAGVPTIVGGEVSDGGAGAGEPDDTTPVAAELTGPPVPPTLVADSITRMVWLSSEAVSVNVGAVAPAIGAQSAAALSQSSH